MIKAAMTENTQIYTNSTCRAGCGKLVSNRSGVCKDCRKFKCKTCGKSTVFVMEAKDVCSECLKKATRTLNDI